MKNCEDMETAMLLGKLIAGEIDIYHLLRKTYKYYDSDVRTVIRICHLFGRREPCSLFINEKIQQDRLDAVQGVAEEDLEPLDSFDEYNPQHGHYTIDHTALVWAKKEEQTNTNRTKT